MQHGKEETEGNGKNLIFFLQNALSFSFYLCKGKIKTQSVIVCET
jgi:hypothetical protein